MLPLFVCVGLFLSLLITLCPLSLSRCLLFLGLVMGGWLGGRPSPCPLTPGRPQIGKNFECKSSKKYRFYLFPSLSLSPSVRLPDILFSLPFILFFFSLRVLPFLSFSSCPTSLFSLYLSLYLFLSLSLSLFSLSTPLSVSN